MSHVIGHKLKGLYAIVDNSFSSQWSHLELAQMFLVGGCKVLQLRMKRENAGLWDQEVYEVAKSIMELKKIYDFTFIVNDYVDVAAELRVDGIHVGSNDMPVDKIKERVGDRLFVGYSSHSIDEGVAAEKMGADYVALGAIYPTKTKGPGHPVQGIEKLQELVSKVSVPVVAIGGISRINIDDVLATGVDCVAMITGLTQAANVVEETKWYGEKIKNPKSKIQNKSKYQNPNVKNTMF